MRRFLAHLMVAAALLMGPSDRLQAGGPITPAAPSARRTTTPDELYRQMAAQHDIAFQYLPNGCYARAQIMVRRMERMNVGAGKVWAFPNTDALHVDLPGGRTVEWSYHVAPVVRFTYTNGTHADWVIDPALFHGPVSIGQWQAAMKKNNRLPYITQTRVGEAPIFPNGLRAPGTGYTIGADPVEGPDVNAVRENAKFKQMEPR